MSAEKLATEEAARRAAAGEPPEKKKKNKKKTKKRKKPRLRMHAEDSDVFLSLSAAMKILLARTVNIEDFPRPEDLAHGSPEPEELPRAQHLLQRFLHAYQKVRKQSYYQLLMLIPLSSFTTMT